MNYKYKYKYKRFLVKTRKWFRASFNIFPWFKEVDKVVALSSYEKKAIKLWKLYLKNKETHLSFNTDNIRQIEIANVLIIFKPGFHTAPGGNNDYLVTIMDISDERKTIYEFHIPYKNGQNAIFAFDMEMDKRMRDAETSKRGVIDDDLDKLIDQALNSLKIKSKNLDI